MASNPNRVKVAKKYKRNDGFRFQIGWIYLIRIRIPKLSTDCETMIQQKARFSPKAASGPLGAD